MKLFICVILISCVSIFGDPMGARITKKQLRGMRKEYLEGLIKESFVKTFDSIYVKILECATLGKNEYRFTIMCQKIVSGNCIFYNGHQFWLQEYPNNIMSIVKSFITVEQYTTNVINALKQTFLDSNITKVYKYCCDYYTIQW